MGPKKTKKQTNSKKGKSSSQKALKDQSHELTLPKLPLENILQILSFTGCPQTICRARQACKTWQVLVDDHPSVWKSITQVTECFRSDAYLQNRGWSPLKLARILYSWDSEWKYSKRKGEVSSDVTPLKSLKDDPKVSEILMLMPMQPTHLKRIPKSQDWDLGDGSFATAIRPLSVSKTFISFVDLDGIQILTSSEDRFDQPFPYQPVQLSRYVLSTADATPFKIDHWHRGQNKFTVHCEDYSSRIPDARVIRGQRQAFGNTLITYAQDAGGMRVWAMDIPALTPTWSRLIPKWPTDPRLHMHVWMDDTHIVMSSYSFCYDLTIIAILDVTTGQIVSNHFASDPIEMNLNSSDPQASLCFDTITNYRMLRDPTITSHKIAKKGSHVHTLRPMMRGYVYFHKLSEAMFSWKSVGQQLHVTVFDAIQCKITHFQSSTAHCHHEKGWLFCVYRDRQGELKGKPLEIDLDVPPAPLAVFGTSSNSFG